MHTSSTVSTKVVNLSKASEVYISSASNAVHVFLNKETQTSISRTIEIAVWYGMLRQSSKKREIPNGKSKPLPNVRILSVGTRWALDGMNEWMH
jgi:hypothetical protein